jgi:predicted transcriptional regulator YheO
MNDLEALSEDGARDGVSPAQGPRVKGALWDSLVSNGVVGSERIPLRHSRTQAALVDAFRRFAQPLAASLGRRSEVVVHDFSRLPNSIAAVEGDLSDRPVGGPITGVLLGWLKTGELDDHLLYLGELDNGTPVQSSTFFIRDSVGSVLGSLCINMDISGLIAMQDYIQGRLRPPEGVNWHLSVPRLGTGNEESPEHYPQNLDSLTQSLIRDAVEALGVPIDLMRKEHRVNLVKLLDKQGFFLLREAAERLASEISVSRHTIYNYLNESRERPSRIKAPEVQG